MSTTIQSTNVHPPTGFSKIAPSEPDSAWSRDDLAVGCDYDVSWTQEDGLKIHAYGQEVGIEDIAATITDLIHFWSRCRAVQDELAARH